MHRAASCSRVIWQTPGGNGGSGGSNEGLCGCDTGASCPEGSSSTSITLGSS